MPIIDWDSKLCVNIKIIDEQHKKLVDMVNALYDAMKEGKAKDILGNLLTELASYTDYHFKTEEELFKKYNYSEAAAHKLEHDKLRKEVIDLKAKFDAGEMIITVEVLYFLKDWLGKHILGSDKKYSPFLISKGVS
jgi:hemerythrin-like metal-binding protein